IALKQAGLTLNDIDQIELNEAFAAQSLAVIKELGIDPTKLNPNGGAIALGHALGSTGARLSVQLFNEMRRRRLRSEEDIVNLLGAPLMGLMPFATEANPGKKSPVGSALRLQRKGNLPELSAPGNN
ncbi:MAG: hypothetical protein RLZZ369_2223, partial [Pseudomonadota bacterium]